MDCRHFTFLGDFYVLPGSGLRFCLEIEIIFHHFCLNVTDFLPVEEEEKKVNEQTEFLIRLVKFAAYKFRVIKEIKSVVEGINLVQAKRFVEELPQVIQQNLSKDDATKLKEWLEAAEGVVEIV